MDNPKRKDIALGKRKAVVLSERQTKNVIPESSESIDTTPNKTVRRAYRPINTLEKFGTQWTIKITVLRKGMKEKYGKTNNIGEMLKLILMDEEGDVIQAVIFNEEIARLEDLFSKGKTSIITNGIAKPINNVYMSSHPTLELILTSNTCVEEVPETIDQSLLRYEFVKITEINKINQDGKIADVLGSVTNVEPCRMFSRGYQKGMGARRSITITDDSNEILQINLWGDLAMFEGDFIAEHFKHTCKVAVTKIKSAFYEGRLTWGTTSCTILLIDPLHPELIMPKLSVKEIEETSDSQTCLHPLEMESQPISIKTLTHDELTEFQGTSCYFEGRVTEIKNLDKAWYNAYTDCKRKVESLAEVFICKFCGGTAYMARFMLRLVVTDGSTQVMVTLFEAAAAILEYSASDLVTANSDDLKTASMHAKLKSLEGKRFNFYLNVHTARDRLKGNIVADKVIEIV